MTNLKEYYLNCQQQIEKEYGSNSVVLMRNGDFYEVYQYENKNERIGRVNEISIILNAVKTRQNKKEPHSKKNLYMTGFPDKSLGKKLQLILDAKYNVAVYEQYKDKYNKITRKLSHVYTSSTYIDNNYDTTSIICIVINKYKCAINKDFRYQVNIVVMNLSIGCVYIHQMYLSKMIVLNEIIQYIERMNTKEIILMDNHEPLLDNIEQYYKHTHLLQRFEIDTKQYKEKYDSKIYQHELLKRVYLPKEQYNSSISIIDYLSLTYYEDILPCLCYMIDYINKHDPYITKKIHKPIIQYNSKNLYINQDVYKELHLYSNKIRIHKYDSVFSIIDKTRTKMGQRLLKYRLLHGITNEQELTKRYDLIHSFKNSYRSYQFHLKHIVDIEKKYRQFILHKLNGFQFIELTTSFDNILAVLKLNKRIILYKQFLLFVTSFKQTFNVTACKTNESLYFNSNVYSDIDNHVNIIKNNNKELTYIADKCSYALDKKKGLIKVEQTEKEGHYLKITKTRWNKLKKKSLSFGLLDKKRKFNIKKLTVKSLSNSIKLTGDIISNLSNSIRCHQQKVLELSNYYYKKIVARYTKQYSNLFKQICSAIAEIDLYCSCIQVSIEYGYIRPSFCNTGVYTKGLRHPIIERIQDSVQYVQNDVTLNNEQKGMVLFGMNASGKSSLLRALGINVVLAQMGMYVSATSFQFKPFTKILGKISSQDDLFTGQSTFIKEMLELKHIYQQMNERSLVLCDELTSGTETASAVGIVSATLRELQQKKIYFMFTTHLHELVDNIDTKNIGIYHFRIIFKGGNVIYERTLQKGSGDKLYGIEIARQLGLSSNFIKNAYEYRSKFLNIPNNLLSNKRSKYNQKKIVDKCEICGSKENLDIHHIREQHRANKHNMIGIYHKNVLHNLMTLCKKCHYKIHHPIIIK